MRDGRLHGSGRSKPRGTSSAEFMLRTARLGAKPLATSKSPRESGLWSSIALRLDRDFENGRPRKAKDRFPAINHDAVPVGGYRPEWRRVGNECGRTCRYGGGSV